MMKLLVTALLACSFSLIGVTHAEELSNDKNIVPTQQDEKNVVSIKLEDIGMWIHSGEYVAQIYMVYDSDKNIVAKRNFFSNVSNPLKLPLGNYKFIVKCANTNGSGPGGVFNFNQVDFNFDQPGNYILSCIGRTNEPNGKGAIVGIKAFLSPESKFKEERQMNVIKFYEEN